jgi:hypothetical protein
LFETQGAGDAIDTSPGHGHIFGVSPIPPVFIASYADHLAAIAEVYLPLAAKRAFSAVNCGIESDPLADFQVPDFLAGSGDYPSGFMAHDQGRDTPARAAVKPVYIAAADSAGLDPDQNLIRPRLGVRDILKNQPVILFENQSFHGMQSGFIKKSFILKASLFLLLLRA